MEKLTLALLLTSTVLLASGCSPSGVKFSSFEKMEINQNISHVYFYRPDKFVASARGLNIMQIDESKDENNIVELCKLYNNSYVYLKFSPGTYKLTTNWLFPPTIFEFQPNNIYCIKMDFGYKDILLQHPNIYLVDKNICENEIKNTSLMSDDDQKSLF
jgi:hypothetical protein